MKIPDETNTQNVCESFQKLNERLNEDELYCVIGLVNGMILARKMREKKGKTSKEANKNSQRKKKESKS